MRRLSAVPILLFCTFCNSPPGLDNRLVGAACQADADCVRKCVNNTHYPSGFCTLHCDDDLACPAGTRCIQDSAGICAVTCLSQSDCAAFGPDYQCEARDRQGVVGQTSVCRVP